MDSATVTLVSVPEMKARLFRMGKASAFCSQLSEWLEPFTGAPLMVSGFVSNLCHVLLRFVQGLLPHEVEAMYTLVPEVIDRLIDDLGARDLAKTLFQDVTRRAA